MTTALNFSEKRTLTSDFSAIKMAELAHESPPQARKYFFERFFVPVITTFWYQEERSDPAKNEVTLRLVPSGGQLIPLFSYGKNEEVINRIIDSALSLNLPTPLYSTIFTLGPPESSMLSEAIKLAFAESIPQNYFSTSQTDILSRCVLVASAAYHDVAGGRQITTNVLTKLRSKVKSEAILLNQAEHKKSPHALAYSTKYSKMYNAITGEWFGICRSDSPDPDCTGACAKIAASPAAANFYDDPEGE